MTPALASVARAVSSALYGYDIIPADLSLPYTPGSRIGTCVKVAEALAPLIEARVIDRCAREVHAFKDKTGRDGTDDWFDFVDLSLLIRNLPSEYVDKQEDLS